MIRNLVLDEIRSSIHSKPIPWNGLVRAGVVSEAEVQSFEMLGKLQPGERQRTVAEQSSAYASLVVQLLQKDIRDDIAKYLVLFVVEYGDETPALAAALAADPRAAKALATALTRHDGQIATLSAVSLTVLATSTDKEISEPILAALEYIVVNMLQNPRNDIHTRDLGAQLLARLMQVPVYRNKFLKFANEALPVLFELVKTGPLQVQYTALLTLWIVSFDVKVANLIIPNVRVVIETVRQAIREKIVRVGVAVLANLLRFARQQSVPVLMAEEALNAVKLVSQRKWTDLELVADLEFVQQTLVTEFERMTTFDEYSAELKAHRLRWSHVHTNPAFWIDNIELFKENHWKPLRELVDLLGSSNTVTRAVACHDISEIVKLAPEAAKIVNEQGGKTRLMELIADGDTEVRFEALKATQGMLAQIFA